MRFLCSTFGSAGDVFPLVGLAVELQRRGHDVTVSTNIHYQACVENSGLPFIPIGSESQFLACAQHPDLWNPRKAFGHIVRSAWPVLSEQYKLHCDWASGNDSYAISNCLCFGARLAQETHRLPLITLHCQPAVIWSDIDPPTLPGIIGPNWLRRLVYRLGERWVVDAEVLPKLNPWRAKLGLAPIKKTLTWWHSPFGILAMFPEWYAQPQSDWPNPWMQTDFPLWNYGSEQPVDDQVELFLRNGSAPIAFTPGSANLHGQRFFQAAMETTTKLGARALFLTEFPEQVPSYLPPSILHARYVPLDRILPGCAAFVHHGGIGSTSQAMLAGIPQVLAPMAHDQFDNAARIHRLGIGASVPMQQISTHKLVATLQHLLGSSTVKENCREIGERLRLRNGVQRSADALEKHIAQTRPRA